jgi:L-lactate dehydrogenase complex protein LldG
MTARDEVLARVRTALGDHPTPPAVVRDYRPAGSVQSDLEMFAERVAHYQATVRTTAADSVAEVVAAALAERGATRVVVPAGFPEEWLPDVQIVPGTANVEELDAVDGVLTTCAVAIAETGTIVLDHGPGQGRRALTVVPDYHLVVVRADQIRALVPDAIAALDPTRPLTWISGPSATSDIELNRVEGVHGPRTLEVVVVA